MIYLVADKSDEKWILNQIDSFSKDDWRHWEFQWYLLSLLATKAKMQAMELKKRS